MHRHHAFNIAEMWTAIALVALALIFAHAMVGCGNSGGLAREQARRMQNNTHVRGIHSGLILFCSGNKDHFPGVHHTGNIETAPIPAAPGVYGTNSVNGADVVYRMAILLRGNYFSPEYMRSPSETNAAIVVPAHTRPGPLVVTEGIHYSYAMLNIANRTAPRSGEWRGTNNSRAPVISDRNIGISPIGIAPTGKWAQSIHTSTGTGWKGSVCWNDNHATFEESDVMKTEYALKGVVAADGLFVDTDLSANNTADADAAMVFKADNSYVNQQP